MTLFSLFMYVLATSLFQHARAFLSWKTNICRFLFVWWIFNFIPCIVYRYLHKLGATFHTWSKRWFVLDRQKGALIYYSDKSERKPRGGAYFTVLSQMIPCIFIHFGRANSHSIVLCLSCFHFHFHTDHRWGILGSLKCCKKWSTALHIHCENKTAKLSFTGSIRCGCTNLDRCHNNWCSRKHWLLNENHATATAHNRVSIQPIHQRMINYFRL